MGDGSSVMRPESATSRRSWVRVSAHASIFTRVFFGCTRDAQVAVVNTRFGTASSDRHLSILRPELKNVNVKKLVSTRACSSFSVSPAGRSKRPLTPLHGRALRIGISALWVGRQAVVTDFAALLHAPRALSHALAQGSTTVIEAIVRAPTSRTADRESLRIRLFG